MKLRDGLNVNQNGNEYKTTPFHYKLTLWQPTFWTSFLLLESFKKKKKKKSKENSLFEILL